ncbi:dynamin family protein [Yoonia maritima]|uniref:dynamin family protein n=1 Tax=Yoonia maritima TaxID=1435347 RepID=UPI0013A67D3D|nr:dynamin family protein [Yoonia maritima]
MHSQKTSEDMQSEVESLLKFCLSDGYFNGEKALSHGDGKLHFNYNREYLGNLLARLREAVALLSHDRVLALIEELDNLSIGVSLIGQVKAGKTALTNALIGKPEMLPSDVNPWTSVVTSVHINTPKPAGKAAVFNFFTTQEWLNMVEVGGTLGETATRSGFDEEVDEMHAQIREMQQRTELRLGHNFALLMGGKHSFVGFSSEMLRKYVCLGDEGSATIPDGRYADVTKSADIYIDSASYRVPTIIHDTPGVNDPFLMREAITLDSLTGTDICVLVLSAQQSFSTVDVALLRTIRSMKKSSIIFFVNRIDALDNPTEQIPEIDSFIRDVLRTEELSPDIPIIFGSAAWAEMAVFGMSETVGAASIDCLTDLAAARLDNQNDVNSSPDPIGTLAHTVSKTRDLSGLFELRKLVETKSISDIAVPHMAGIARRALDIARTSKVFLQQVDETNWVTPPSFDMDAAIARLETIQDEVTEAVAAETEAASNAMTEKMSNAYQAFCDREQAALEAELSETKRADGWTPQIEGLRRSLIATYSDFARETPPKVDAILADAVQQVQSLYNSALGNSVQLIAVEPLETQSLKNPACLMRTMPLDITSNWLRGWLSKRAKRPSYIRKLRQLVAAEQRQTLEEIQTANVADFMSENNMLIDGFFEEHMHGLRTIAMLNDQQKRDEALHALGMEEKIKLRIEKLREIIDELTTTLERLALATSGDLTGREQAGE